MGRLTILVLTLLALSGWPADKAAAEAVVENADKQMEIARYYVGRGDYTGAINRYKIVAMRFESSQYVEEALAGLTEAYLRLGVPSEASTAAAALECRFPNGQWIAKAKALLRSTGLAPAENPASWISQVCR